MAARFIVPYLILGGTMDKIKLRYEELKKQIEYHSDRYYNQDDPEISDFEYDMLMLELKT